MKPAMQGNSTDHRRVFRFFAFGGVSAAVQKAVVPRLAAAVALPRAVPATAFAPLNYMLKKGFFFVQGFFMSGSLDGMLC